MKSVRRSLLLLLALLLVGPPARAEGTRVLLVRPQKRDPTLVAAFNRLHGELAASGFTVVIHEEQFGATPKALAAAARTQGAFASIAIVRSNGNTTADVWISDRVTGKTSARTIATANRDAPDLLAVRATDLLKVSLREFGDRPTPADIASADPKQTLPDEVKQWAAPPPEPLPQFRLHAGAAALGGVSEIAPGSGPRLALGAAVLESLEIRVEFAGPLLTPDWTPPTGRVGIRQELVLLGPDWSAVSAGGVTLQLAIAGGAYHLAVRGEAEPPLIGQSDEVWAVAAAAGLGLTAQLSAATALELGAAAVFTLPEAQVKLGQEQDRLGQPRVLAHAGLRVGL